MTIIPELTGTYPWWVWGAVDFIAERIRPDWRVFEWGAGGSTLWFAQRVAWVDSYEHNSAWYMKTRGEVEEYGLQTNVNLWLERDLGQYAAAIRYCVDMDLVAVDGRNRAECIRHAIPKLKPGGYLVLDNSEREQYQEAMHLMDGWERHDFDKTPEQSGYAEWRTTVWRKPIEDPHPAG